MPTAIASNIVHYGPLIDDMRNGLHIDNDGTKRWYLNDKTHREEINPITGLSLPAVEFTDGSKYWACNGQRHRDDGPAAEYANGGTAYYINGNHIAQLNNMSIYGKENLAKYLALI